MTRFAAIVPALCLALGAPAGAEGDPQAGKTKSVTCAACHGTDGNSINPEWPSLAGQHPQYTIRQLKAYKSGERENVLMTSQAAGLTEQDIADLAAYFAQQTLAPKEADPGLAGRGERIYRGGNKETHVSACIACHGPRGLGNPPAGYPEVHGQHATYLLAQLKAYASGQRRSDPNQMMRNIASLMSEEEMRSVASYLQGLRP